jgi:hypothetical protein
LPNGTIREFRHDSNQFPFTIAPRIDTISPPVSDVVTITGYIDPDPNINLDIQLYLGANRLTRTTGGGGLNAGEYRVTGPDASKISMVELKLLAPLASQQSIPIRIMVAGAEAGPAWITAP